MAKGNLFLGTARRSVGDVTLYRRDGEQVARTRVRSISNPKSTGQSVQRSFFAPVARFYSPFAVALEQSYEGLSKSKSYSKFLKTNIDLARSRGWFVPKGAQFLPLPYKVSSGSIAPLQYRYDAEVGGISVYTPSLSADARTLGAVSAALVSMGYEVGDQVTFVVVLDMGNGDYLPDFARFNIDTASTTTLAAFSSGHQFQLATPNNNYLSIQETEYPVVAAAVIVSRFYNGAWRRSTQYMVLDPDVLALYTSEDAKNAAVQSYGPAGQGVGSDVYLNGSTSRAYLALGDGRVVLITGLSTSGNVLTLVDSEGASHMVVNSVGSSDDNADYGDVISATRSAWVAPPTNPSESADFYLRALDGSIDGDLRAFLLTNGVSSSVFQ